MRMESFFIRQERVVCNIFPLSSSSRVLVSAAPFPGPPHSIDRWRKYVFSTLWSFQHSRGLATDRSLTREMLLQRRMFDTCWSSKEFSYSSIWAHICQWSQHDVIDQYEIFDDKNWFFIGETCNPSIVDHASGNGPALFFSCCALPLF